jgi:hypothetical protein
MKLKLLTLLCLFFLVSSIGLVMGEAATPGNNTTIIKELPQKQELENFITEENYSTYFTNIATLDATKKHPTWPHDVWSDPKGNFYISFYYENNSSPVGYTSVYYDDCGRKLPSKCFISFELIEPYYGLNVTEKQNTTPIHDEERLCLVTNATNETVTQVISVTNETVVRVDENNTMYPVSNQKNDIQANNTNIRVDNLNNNGIITQQIGNIYNNFMINVQNLKVYFEGH